MRGSWVGAARGARIAAVVLAGALLVGGAPAAAAPSGTVFVVNGLTGTSLDLYVDDENVRPAADTATVVGPLSLAVGEHAVSLRSGGQIVTQARFTVEAGSSTDLVAHLLAQAGGTPGVTVFPNDLTAVAPGKGRLVVSHTAATAPVDLTLDGEPLVRNVANGESFTSLVPARTYSLELLPTATSGPAVLGPVAVAVRAGTLTRVFAIGDAAQSTLDVVVQEVPLPVSGAVAPSVVPTGDGGQAATGLFDDPSVLGGLGAGAVAVALIAVAGFGRRTRRVSSGGFLP